MADMISVATGFQSSVNISYDINDDKKLKNYIPTKAALQLLEDILLSTGKDATDRAHILIGAYGKGKSHIVLMILSLLMKKDISLFEKLIPVIQNEKPELYQLIQNYYRTEGKILPVIISGSSNSLAQAFLLALQRTLAENELTDIMPETNYQAAQNTIKRWKEEFPETYKNFDEHLIDNIEDFERRLESFDPLAYEEFEKLYPLLTSGSAFNPFIGFDVVDLYEEVIKTLRNRGYSGIYVIYDEFSKYLENHISDATKSDTKILQDFAEKCGRSANNQLHLMLISHKDVTSYIDRASKSMVDGWRGVSERFRHVYLNNNFTQTYEIISVAIEKKADEWNKFLKKNEAQFENLMSVYKNHAIFSDTYDNGINKIIYDCYPLHPVSTFILPRLSERVAQNERTLFTFLSATGESTLSSFLKKNEKDIFILVTPDLIYDYFEPLLKQEVYSGNLHKYYMLTTSILRKIDENSLDAKIVKTISLIYILEQFEKLRPTFDELSMIYAFYGTDEVNAAIKRLVDDKYVVYLKRSNNYLRLKETSGLDIRMQISNVMEKRASRLNGKEVLNNSNFDHYLYPSRYNDEKEMTRFFDFRFIDSSEVEENTNWSIKRENIKSDGVVFAIIPENENEISRIEEVLKKSSYNCKDCVFVLPKNYIDIRTTISEFDAVQILMQNVTDDPVLFEDYEIVYEDLRDVLRTFIEIYTRPEKKAATFIYNGNEERIARKSELTSLLSKICDELFGLTPVINNEVINKEELTAVTQKSRSKVIAGLLRTDLEENLGLAGSGQDVSIMRSTLLNKGILISENGTTKICLNTEDKLLSNVFKIIEDFITSARKFERVSFSVLYDSLTNEENHIGMRRGLIPIYIACVLHEYKKEIVINDRYNQISMSADVLEQINASPELFSLSYIDWNPEKEAYLAELEQIFEDYVLADAGTTSYERVMIAMKRWYMSLPKYAKNTKRINGQKLSKEEKNFMQEIRKNSGSYELIFQTIPHIFSYNEIDVSLATSVKETKEHFDYALQSLKNEIGQILKMLFCVRETAMCEKMSVASIIRDWCEKIEQAAFDQLFTDGTDRCLSLFKTVSNDEDLFISAVAKMATDLRLEDWDEEVIQLFEKNLCRYRDTAEAFHIELDIVSDSEEAMEDYELTYKEENGQTITKRFAKVEESRRGKLLYNSIQAQLDSMGQAISEQEKRQILMEILKEMC